MISRILIILGIVSIIIALSLYSRKNLLYDYKEVTSITTNGKINFRLIGSNKSVDEPKKIRYRTNPYSFVIRYISNNNFDYAVISNLEFKNSQNNELIFKSVKLESKKRGGTIEPEYAGFYYGDISETFNLEYIDYEVSGSLKIYYSDGSYETHQLKETLKIDFKKKYTLDFWEAIMSV